jgi:predicted TIM-barrel fold metal-dependent hydrolase
MSDFCTNKVLNTSSATTLMLESMCDCHFHVFDAVTSVNNARYRPSYPAEFVQWRDQASPIGVRRGVVVQPSFLGTDNQQLLQVLEKHVNELRGVAVVSPSVTKDALNSLSLRNVRGLRINLFGISLDNDVLRAYDSAFWDRVLEVGFHVELHANTGQIATLINMIPRDITIVLDHFARPNSLSANDATLLAVANRARQAPTYVTLSGHYRLENLGNAFEASTWLARAWLDCVGEDALLWGSDWPHTNFEGDADYAGLHQFAMSWINSQTTRTKVFSANALRVYWRR